MNFELDYLELDEEFYDLSQPTPLEEPYLISFNSTLAKEIDLDEDTRNDPLLVELLNTSYKPDSSKYFSMCYAGHQFGSYAPRLGDGRVSNLGKISQWNLQLKGSGETLYSRMADGRATIKSSLREYLIGEMMYHLGIPTTRALAIIGSKTKIIRDQIENAGIILRLSRSWIRFGSFEYFYYTKAFDKLQMLADYAIKESFSHLENKQDKYLKMFEEVVYKTAKLVAKWQAIGFCHGVLNTDNMSIEGLSIDYGPFSMLDDFNYNYVCNHTDKIGRYSYGEQPNVVYWNLTMLAKAFSPLANTQEMNKILDSYGESIYPNAYIDEMRLKLGLELKENEDIDLIRELIGTLQDVYVDHTLFFRTLSSYDGDREALFDIVMEPVVLDQWLNLYDNRLKKETLSNDQRHKKMLQINPKYILKNYMLDEAIRKVQNGDCTMVDELLYIASHPFDDLPQYEKYASDTPDIYKNIGLSCSS